jgi:hypothetical protein
VAFIAFLLKKIPFLRKILTIFKYLLITIIFIA